MCGVIGYPTVMMRADGVTVVTSADRFDLSMMVADRFDLSMIVAERRVVSTRDAERRVVSMSSAALGSFSAFSSVVSATGSATAAGASSWVAASSWDAASSTSSAWAASSAAGDSEAGDLAGEEEDGREAAAVMASISSRGMASAMTWPVVSVTMGLSSAPVHQ